jgi:hypothetical protein
MLVVTMLVESQDNLLSLQICYAVDAAVYQLRLILPQREGSPERVVRCPQWLSRNAHENMAAGPWSAQLTRRSAGHPGAVPLSLFPAELRTACRCAHSGEQYLVPMYARISLS